jgi:arylsulfatase A-like enzyme
MRRLTLGVAALWLGVGAYGAAGLSDDGEGYALFEERLTPSALGITLVTWITDVDRDGHRPVLGGNDCAPFDPSIHPGAVDIPGDGIDQDCDGRDLTVDDLVQGWGRWDHSVPASVPHRPPIVLITVEALAARRMHALGYHRETTPHLDALIDRGVLFENGFSHGPSTRLSFPSLFTGLWSSDIRRRLEGKPPYPIEPNNHMMAEILRDAGYRTAAVVPVPYFTPEKWEGIDQGFEALHRVTPQVKHAHVARKVNDLAVRAMDAAGGDAPFFLWVHHYDTHPPHRQPEGVASFGDEVADKFDAELLHVDAHLGELVERAYERLGPDTLVIITGDHGISHRKPRHVRRHYGYDLHTTTLHVPILFLAPYLKPRRITTPATHLEVLPTLANLLRLDALYRFRGESLLPELLGRPATRPSFVFHQFLLPDDAWRGEDPLRMVAVRTPDHHMVLNRRNGRRHLWHWPVDHDELDDLMASDDPTVEETAAMLEQLLSAFVFEATGAAKRHLGERR